VRLISSSPPWGARSRSYLSEISSAVSDSVRLAALQRHPNRVSMKGQACSVGPWIFDLEMRSECHRNEAACFNERARPSSLTKVRIRRVGRTFPSRMWLSLVPFGDSVCYRERLASRAATRMPGDARMEAIAAPRGGIVRARRNLAAMFYACALSSSVKSFISEASDETRKAPARVFLRAGYCIQVGRRGIVYRELSFSARRRKKAFPNFTISRAIVARRPPFL